MLLLHNVRQIRTAFLPCSGTGCDFLTILFANEFQFIGRSRAQPFCLCHLSIHLLLIFLDIFFMRNSHSASTKAIPDTSSSNICDCPPFILDFARRTRVVYIWCEKGADWKSRTYMARRQIVCLLNNFAHSISRARQSVEQSQTHVHTNRTRSYCITTFKPNGLSPRCCYKWQRCLQSGDGGAMMTTLVLVPLAFG